MKKSGPGKWFRKGITLIEVIAMFPDDESAEKWFASMRWPDGPACPRCRGSSVQSDAAHPSMPYRCRGCGKRFAVRTGSVMADTKLGYRTRAVALFLLTTGIKGVSSMKLHRDPGISRKSAWHLAHRIRACWERDQGLFTGPVQGVPCHRQPGFTGATGACEAASLVCSSSNPLAGSIQIRSHPSVPAAAALE